MGHCCVCKKKSVRGSGLSFFSFPKDELLCNEWLKACGFPLHAKNDTSRMKLCSDHFAESNFRITKKDGPKLLKQGAIPPAIIKKMSQVVAISSTEKSFSLVGGAHIIKQEGASINKKPNVFPTIEKSFSLIGGTHMIIKQECDSISNEENVIPTSENSFSFVGGTEKIIKQEHVEQKEELHFVPTSEKSYSLVGSTQNIVKQGSFGSLGAVRVINLAALGASIIKEPNKSNISTSEQTSVVLNPTTQLSEAEKETSPKKRKIWGPRHAWEMSPSHFDTPRKAKRNLDIIISDFKKKDKRIKQLSSKTYRMRKKIQSLENIIEHLRNKELNS